MGFTFDIIYQPGPSNQVADALSRRQPNQVEMGSLVATCGASWDQAQQLVNVDPVYKKLKEDILQNTKSPLGFTVENGILKYKGRLVLPKDCPLIQTILHEYHDKVIGGHAGELKTFQRIAKEWFWSGMRQKINQYVRACSVCQQNKTSTLKPAGLLQPLPIPSQVWDDISLDFI